MYYLLFRIVTMSIHQLLLGMKQISHVYRQHDDMNINGPHVFRVGTGNDE